MYKGLPQHILTETVNEPSEERFEYLKSIYEDSIQCSASQISVEYVSIIKIFYSTHQICKSDFLKKNFIFCLFKEADLPFIQDDFRSQSVSFFHLLNSLCYLTGKVLTDSLIEFDRTLLINSRILSRREFESQVQSIIIEFKQKLPTNFMLSLKLFQDYVQENQLITLSASNWKFVARYKRHGDLVSSIPVIRSDCSCATSNLCFELAKLYIDKNRTLTIQGFQLGCTPLDSVLSSTLQCFYQQSCINDLMYSFKIPLNITTIQLHKTQFALNLTIETLVKNLFIEQWNSTTNYSNYYTQVHPTQCLYSHAKRNQLLHVIIDILGLYGGLTAALYFLVPKMIRLIFKII